MSILSKRVHCVSCHSKDTHLIVSKSAGQFKSRFLFGRAYYCCQCGNRGRVGGGIRCFRFSAISLLSSILLLSLYANFIGFQSLDVTPDKSQEITINPSPDPLLLVIDPIDQAEISLRSKPAPMTKPIASLESFRRLKPTSMLDKSMARSNTNIPRYWHD